MTYYRVLGDTVAKLRSAVQAKIYNCDNLSSWYMEYKLRKEVQRVESVESRKGWLRSDFLDYQRLVECTREKIGDKISACHIVASGWSVTDSISKIDKSREFVVSFNFGAICGLCFDMYFIELGAYEEGRAVEVSKLLVDLVSKMAANNIKNLYLKNCYSDGVDAGFVNKYYRGFQKINEIHLPDIPLDQSDRVSRSVTELMLKPGRRYLVQYGSSTLSCVFLAVHLGFSRIVVHGLDFVGPHFFSEGSFGFPTTFMDKLQQYYPPVSATELHATGTPVMNFLPTLRDVLRQKGVTLYSGSSRSPSARILPVFQSPRA